MAETRCICGAPSTREIRAAIISADDASALLLSFCCVTDTRVSEGRIPICDSDKCRARAIRFFYPEAPDAD